MKFKRTIPPTAAPITPMDLMYGFYGIVNKKFNAKLENEIKEYFGTEYAYLVSSGKAALSLILSGLKRLTGKNKVIIPAYTCFSVPSVVRMAGLEIVLCDIRPETLDFDFSELRSLVDDDTLCIISTHLFGIPSDIAKIRDLLGNRKIYIIEDAAQAMGAVQGHEILGTIGDVAFFSLGRGKNITCGSGGIVITSSEEIAHSVQAYLSDYQKVTLFEYVKIIAETIFLTIFIHPHLYWFPKNMPFLNIGETRFYRTFTLKKLTGFQAGLLYNWRKKMEIFNQSRSSNAEYFRKNLPFLNGMPIYADSFQYLRFPIYMKNKSKKDQLCERGNALGISPMYPSPINKITELKESFPNSKYGYADMIADTLVTLPTHVLLGEKDKMAICEVVKNFSEIGSVKEIIQQNVL